MLKLAVMLMLGIVLGNAANAANAAKAADAVCDGEVKGEGYLSERYVFKVVGKGRLHFHSMPNPKCAYDKVFVIPGDTVTAYSVFGKNEEWANVGYMTKDGDDVSGWVRTDRLQFESAFGMQMTPEKTKVYEAAAKAAKAGKLGMP